MRSDSKEPWYRARKDTWYAWVNGRQISLGVKGAGNRAAAAVAMGRLLAGGGPRAARARVTVADLCAAFLAHCDGRVAGATMQCWRRMLGMFAERFGPVAAETLDPDAVGAWCAAYGKSAASGNTLLTAVVACVRWGVRTKRLRENPLAGLRKRPQPSRGAKVALTEEQFDRLFRCAGNAGFRTFLRGLWLTGCRPGELSALTAADVDLTAGVAVLTEHKTAGKTGAPRLIFLAPEAVELFRAQAAAHPSGALFRNHWRRPWQKDTLVKAMQAARTRAGLPHAICYGLRHSFATAALVRGIPDATVAALLGHASTTMLHKHYAHLTARAQVMREAAARVRTE